MTLPARNSLILVLLGMVWAGAVGLGMQRVLVYENTPGPDGSAPEQWPAASPAPRAAGQPTLVMLLHPRCPCARASLGELALLMTHCPGRVQATVLFLKPAGVNEEWVHTDVWNSAARIPGVHVMEDSGGVEARRFGALTSGQTLLYDAQGRLLFSGGITDGRGHAGDNPGRDAIEALLRESRRSERKPTFSAARWARGARRQRGGGKRHAPRLRAV